MLFMDARRAFSQIDRDRRICNQGPSELAGDDCEFVRRLERLNEDLDTLKAEAGELGYRIAKQIIRLLETLR